LIKSFLKNYDISGLIIGCGSIGERHLYNLKKIGINNLSVFDKNKLQAEKISKKYKIKKFNDIHSSLDSKPTFSIISTFPSSHIELANLCIDANSHLFIEKPISSDMNGVERLLRRSRLKKLKVAIGYNMRFERGLQTVKKKLADYEIGLPLTLSIQWGHNIKFWRPGKNYKDHYVLKKGGGIVLDDSHEYDYVRWLLDDDVKSVYAQTKKINSIKTKTDSLSAFILKFKKGTIASFMIDYVRPQYERKCQIIGEKGDLKWQLIPQPSSWKDYNSMASTYIETRFIHKRKNTHHQFNFKMNTMYSEEIHDFVKSIIFDKKPLVDGLEGLKTLKIGMAILKSAKQNKVVSL